MSGASCRSCTDKHRPYWPRHFNYLDSSVRFSPSCEGYAVIQNRSNIDNYDLKTFFVGHWSQPAGKFLLIKIYRSMFLNLI